MANQLSEKKQRFNLLWLAETIRLQEDQQGVLDDAEAVRQAKREAGELEQRILTRAKWLANKTNLFTAQQHTMTAIVWAIRILLVFAVFVGVGLVLPTFSTQDHTINIFSALGCLLGLNMIMLFIWLVGSFIGGSSISQLGRLGLWLTSKLTGKQQVVQLIPALLALLHQRRLERWCLGRITNAFWLLASLIALASLFVLLATQRYGFIWQTTILSADTFVAIVHLLGSLPSLVGFPIPSEALIRQSGDIAVMTDIARQTWASWLVGVLIVYGILPRLIFYIVCTLLWRYGYQRLSLNLSLPRYALLKSRLSPDRAAIGVTDKEPDIAFEPTAIMPNGSRYGKVIVGIELESHYPWPPMLPMGVDDAGMIDSREQRKELLDRLTNDSVAKLLIICDPKRTVDRGTLNLIAELAHCATATKVGLIINQQTDQQRLADWQDALDRLQLTYGDLLVSLAWLGGGDE